MRGKSHHTVLNIGTCTFLGEPKPDPLANKNGPCANEMLEQQHHYLNDLMLKLRPHFVILNGAYPQDLTKPQADEYARRAKLRMELIESFGGIPVLMLPRPKLGEIQIRSCLGRPFLETRSVCEKPRELAMEPFENLTTTLKAIKHDIPSLKMVSQEDYLCDSDHVCRFMRQGMPIIRDSGAEHYSEYGSRQFGNYVARWAETELPALLDKSNE